MQKWVLLLTGLFLSVLSYAGTVDINRADAETIARELDGIGSARARAIVEYRAEFGEFESIDELLNVAGIGEQILESNRERIVLTSQ